MPRLFVSTAYTTQADTKTGTIQPEFREFIEQVTAALRKIDNLTVFCGVEHEGWVISKDPPQVSIQKDIAEIRNADFLVALLSTGASLGGVHFEMGLAYGLGKKVFVATEPNTDLGFFDQGAVNAGYITHISYKDAASLAKQIGAAI